MFCSLLAHHSGRSNFQGVPVVPRDPWLIEELCGGASLPLLPSSGEQLAVADDSVEAAQRLH